MSEQQNFFAKNFQKSISSVYREFYQPEELKLLETELYTLYQESERTDEMVWSKIYSHDGSDKLLRIHLSCIVIVCKSMPFFAGKIRNLFHKMDVPIGRSLQFHPCPGKEFYYIEINSENQEFLHALDEQIETSYHRIKIITADYNHFKTEVNPIADQLDENFKKLIHWLLEKGFVWEGGVLFIDGKKFQFGEKLEIELEKEWLNSQSNDSSEVQLFTKEINKIGFLEQTNLYFLGFSFLQSKIGFLGSFNQLASTIGINNIPLMEARFHDFLQSEGIESFSGLGRSVRRIFNAIPPEILFLMPQSAYISLFQVIIEQSLRTKNHSSGFLIGSDLGILITSIPQKNWEEGKWEEAAQIIEQYLPGATIRTYLKNLSSSLQGFHLIRYSGITQTILFQISSQLENLFTPWLELLRGKWEDRFKEEPFPEILDFRKDYIATHDSEKAIYDLDMTRKLGDDKLILGIFQTENRATLIQAITHDREFPLSKWVNAFTNLGLSPISQRVYRFHLNNQFYSKIEFFFELFPNHNLLYERLKTAVYYIMKGKLPSDGLSAMILRTDLDANEIYFLKAIRDYCLQTNPYFNKGDFNEILLHHSEFSQELAKYFVSKFKDGKEPSINKLKELTEAAKTLREDEVLKSMSSAARAILRTDFFGGANDLEFGKSIGLKRDTISFKIDSSIPSSLPLPRPFREIFVYSSQIMGIHLRGGEVARGGLRHSDRISDFRTEVLSLMKTQMIKNTVIVPVGSKGGFVILKNQYINQDITVVDAYKLYITALLSVTDNRKGTEPIAYAKAKGPFAFDSFDPYLVVAADKGTASFSDIANGISTNLNFWLGDAFASGGSKGYSHKEYGITAKGALVTADRQLRKLDIDYLREPVTVVGIGDMGGDVFGNGLLNSKYFKLLAAFNHKHIFLDPNPDPAKSYEERKRLFESKESGWDHYDKSLISNGGGVFDKTQKSIKITPEVKHSLGIEADELSGQALINAILKTPVDLFYNGGIGTYVKSEEEENSEVGDPLNNEVRINGTQLRAKVVSEGGNLGFTQLGRIEYALKGGRIYTDALDNSAGVDLSDHEVNLKLFFSYLLVKGKIKNQEERDAYMKEIAASVCHSVLLDNELQSLAVDTDEYESEQFGWKPFIESSQYFISKGLLNPNTEKVPARPIDWEEWQAKSKRIPTPVLCVLLAYPKMDLYSEAISTDLFRVEDYPLLYNLYFPERIQNQFKQELQEHPLKKEILLTQLVNFYINLLGSTGILLLKDKDKIRKLEKFKAISDYLYTSGAYETLVEVASTRDKRIEAKLAVLLSKIRDRVRSKWTVSDKINLNDLNLDRTLSIKAKNIIEQI
jgi:glutamate dehydrogenase